MRRFTALMSAVMVASFVLIGSAAGAAALDQQQTTLDPSQEVGIGGDGPQVLAQIVTSGIPGLLTQVDLPVGCGSSDLVVEIREILAGPPLMSQTVSGLGGAPEWHSFTFPASKPVFMPADWEFAIVLSSPGSCGILASALGANPYPRGDGFYQGPPNPPGVWVTGGHDLGFKTFVEPICQVPGLTVGPLAEAKATLVRYGCSLGKVTAIYSLTFAKGTLIGQEQSAGTRLPAGGAVNLVVSLGKPPCKVPSVHGKTLRKARPAILRANCRVGAVRTAPSTKALRGRVVTQRPAAGTRRSYKTRVNLVIGRGGR